MLHRAGSVAAVVAVFAVFAVVGALGSASVAHARCDPSGADAADVAAARAAIATACACAGARNHGSYVRCARETAQAALANASCLGTLTRCAARSTCGRRSAVACCRTSANGVTRATIKGRESACRAPRGGAACVSPLASACDACTATGCATPAPTATPRPTPTPGCGNGIVDPGEDCDGETCTATLASGEQVPSTCGAPGTLHACECRDQECGRCLVGPPLDVLCTCGPDLCWPSDACVEVSEQSPHCTEGVCIPSRCETPSDCGPLAPVCEDGRCCVSGFAGPDLCRVAEQFVAPCCGAAVCGPEPTDTCCLPAGGPCTFAATCCSGSCTTGSCD